MPSPSNKHEVEDDVRLEELREFWLKRKPTLGPSPYYRTEEGVRKFNAAAERWKKEGLALTKATLRSVGSTLSRGLSIEEHFKMMQEEARKRGPMKMTL